MALPFSKSQVVRLGERLVKAGEPSDEDLVALSELLLAYDDTLACALEQVRALGFEPTSRVKNTGTILEKLTRHGGSWLKSMQDLAGMRIVIDGNRTDQNEAVARIAQLFAAEGREPKVTDRRVQPSEGYRAVHVIVYSEGLPVEVQVRTRWQHEWADMFEKLADLIGRGIRYGEPPTHWWSAIERMTEGETPEKASAARRLYDISYKWHVLTVKSAISLSDMIDALEEAEVTVGVEAADLRKYWADVRQHLADLREQMDGMTPVSERGDIGTLST
ncbi:nucleotidyltransferase family protein [Streptomyces rochei]|uniref:hypothetical protein n=1 Tax=Streptomyces rochei TaxID=1928 RepID=UPI0036946529